MIADQEGVPRLGEAGRLGQVAERAVGDPEPPAGDQPPHLGHQVAHEADLVGVAIGMGPHGHGQAAAHVQGDQGPPPQQAAGDAPQRLEPLGHPLDGLAIEDDDLIIVQALGQWGLGRGIPGVDLAGAVRCTRPGRPC